MPIRVQNDLPVKEILEQENIFVRMNIVRCIKTFRPHQDWSVESDALEGGYRTSDFKITVKYTIAGRCGFCECVQP